MKDSRIIYATTPPKLFADLRLFCKLNGLKYNTYCRKKFPFDFKGIQVFRVSLIKKQT